MKKIVRVAAVQIGINWLDPEANLAKVVDSIQKITGEHQVDLIGFPKLVNSGYVIGREREEFSEFSRKYLSVAEKIPGRYTYLLGKLAMEYGVPIFNGLLEVHPFHPSDALQLSRSNWLRRWGLGIYRKVHILAE
jgi:predicted amidohydrolase